MPEFVTDPILLGPVAAVLLLLAIVRVFTANYIKVPPSEVAVFFGRGESKMVSDAGHLRIPGLETYKTMDLTSISVKVKLQRVPARGGVPVNVDAVGMVRFGTTTDARKNAVGRFLTLDRAELHTQINDILEGSLRGIVATMSVEELNGNREQLAQGVITEAGGDLERIGMEVSVLKIQSISDDGGYLEALGARRLAEVKRDAEIGQAEARRDAKIRSADAIREGEVAQATADTAIAEAQQRLDIRRAELAAEVEAEQARQKQAGPLADAEARMAVLTATEQAEAARVEARTRVETLREEEQRRRLAAEVVAPAEADRQAAIARAEGERQATILAAQATAERVRQEGAAEADARTTAAAATQAEQEAEAAGLLARLKAEAEGQRDLADALNQFGTEAVRLQTLPAILKAFVDATAASAAPLEKIDSISIIGNGADNGQGLLGGVLGITPQNLAGVIQTLRNQGIDLPAMLNGNSGTNDGMTHVVESTLDEADSTRR